MHTRTAYVPGWSHDPRSLKDDTTELAACQSCLGGYYCPVPGLAFPAEPCSSGYFCRMGAISASPSQGIDADAIDEAIYRVKQNVKDKKTQTNSFFRYQTCANVSRLLDYMHTTRFRKYSSTVRFLCPCCFLRVGNHCNGINLVTSIYISINALCAA